jgi:hypothetical protein
MVRFSPFRFVLVALAGWVNQQQRDVIDYLQEENRSNTTGAHVVGQDDRRSSRRSER